MNDQETTVTIPTRLSSQKRDVHSPGNGWRVGNVGLLLIQAAKQGSRDSLEFLFGSVPQAREQVDYTDNEHSETPLMIAAKNGHLECVKLLISYGADLSKRSSPQRHLLSKSQGILQLAEKAGHPQVASYIQQCLEDQKNLNTTRAHLERTACSIASSPTCTDSDLNMFSMSLRNLIWLRKCDINVSLDGETPSLLHRAVQANNFNIVLKLLNDFKANPMRSNHKTGESILHTACRLRSDLRFFIANRYPDLLRKRNVKALAEQPLHIACTKNDIVFVSWLFKNILAEESAMDEVCTLSSTPSTLPRCESLATVKENSAKLAIPQKLYRRTTTVVRPPPAPNRSLLQVNATDNDPDYSDLEGSRERSLELQTPDADSIDDRFMFPIDSSIRTSNGHDGHDSNFDSSLSKSGSSVDARPSSPRRERTGIRKMKITDILQKSPLTISEVCDLLPSLTSNGDSVFHILARENYVELLTRVLKVAEFVSWRINLSMLVHRYFPGSLLPVEEAIRAKNLECVETILHFMNISDLLPELLQDQHILKNAVLTGDLDIVKVLISYGFHKGLQAAITQAIKVGNGEILRVLLHYQTKVMNAIEFSHITDDQVRALHHSNGGIKWEGLELESIDLQWLYDCYDAVDSVSKACGLIEILLSGDDSHLFFHQLGLDCLNYFSRAIAAPQSPIKHPPYQLTMITRVNLNKNRLTEIPLELFQLPLLQSLALSHNRLKSLPSSSEYASERIYAAPISNLDLDHNELQTLPECLFRDLAHSLTELNASWNSLSDLPPGLWVIPKLTVLKLAHNNLSQLHYFSDLKYFNDRHLSDAIVGSFRVSSGILVCEDASKDESTLHQLETYMHNLADFRNTVCAVKFLSAGVDQNTMSDMMGIHIARIEYFSSSEQQRPRTASTPTIQGECLFPVNNGEEKESTVSNLTELDLSHNKFVKFPWDLACSAPQLMKLYMQNNVIQDLDIVHSIPLNLESLLLDENVIVSLKSDRPKSLPCGHPFRLLTVPEIDSHKRYCWHCKHRVLERLSLLSLARNQLHDFPSVQIISEALKQTDYNSYSYETLYPNLSILSLEHNLLQKFPGSLHHLTKLSSVKLSYNQIQELPPEVGLLNSRQLLVLKMDGMSIQNVPPHLLQKPSPKLLLNYLRAIQQNSKPYRRVKLMVVGESKKGKTSLLYSLTKKGKFKNDDLSTSMVSDSAPEATVGVDIRHWSYAPRNKSKITFMIWDFGGPDEYYAIHQCFLSKRSLYMLVWNVQDEEAGVRGLKTWLENIEAHAPKSSVIIVGTQMNITNESQRRRVKGRFTRLINDLYVNYSHSAYQYPKIRDVAFIYNQDDVDRLRDYMHDFASKYQFGDSRDSTRCSIVDQLVPASYLQLQDIIQSLASNCRMKDTVPIFDKETYRQEVQKAGFTENLEEMDEATNFLHENGILLHYDEGSVLSDIYFLDPQWLCSNLAKVVTVREDISSHKYGFMLKNQLEQILDTKYQKEIIALMEHFGIILFLDDKRLLVPSLLPCCESKSYTVFSKKLSAKFSRGDDDDTMAAQCEHFDTPHTPLCKSPHQCLVRYYRLPFIPNGFFARVIARFMSTNMIDYIQSSLKSGPLDDTLTNQAHWKCWRDGIIITWHHMEIFRIAPITFPLPGTTDTHLISSEGDKPVKTSKGIEIKIAIMPEEIIVKSNSFPNEHSDLPVSSHCRATWLLHQATTIVNSVFEDWYEVFAKNTTFDFNLTANPCIECLKSVCKSERDAFVHPAQQPLSPETQSNSSHRRERVPQPSTQPAIFYMFTSPYCSRAVADGKLDVECPTHGKLSLNAIAPDLVFCDFPSSLVVTDSDSLTLGNSLGDGGYGSVFKGILVGQKSTSSVAVKEFHTTRFLYALNTTIDQAVIAEDRAWETYQKASLEARVMIQLRHPNIVNLIGVTLQPLRLLVELAPMGDIKHCIAKFQKASIRLRRTTLKETLLQIADAMDYIHSNYFVYRDLKGGNVLVWKYPEPDSQWNPNAQVWVKVADYGISKQVSPQGLRGESGTRPYLPPEVLLYGGKEAYSTKIDVYAFGMFIYYLMTYLSPFQLQDRPLTVLLAEGRRPQLPSKLHPQSLQLFELMCWCWSDKPQHRPTFRQILKIIKADSFTHLLEATPMTAGSKKNQITAACLRPVISSTPPSRVVRTLPSISDDGFTMTYCTASKVLSPVEIWYGTRCGACGVVCFHQSLTVKNFKLPVEGKVYISSILTVGSLVWIGTGGSGLFVYRIHTHKPVASWGRESSLEIFTILHVRKTASILALTHDGILIFDSNISTAGMESPCILEPRQTIERSGPLDINQGVVIPATANIEDPEIWVCSSSGRGFTILHNEKYSTIDEVYYSDGSEEKGRMVRHMQPILVDGRSFLAVADRHLIERWDVKLRQKKDQFDMMTHCTEFFGSQRRKSRITTMTASDDLLYVGTGGGVLLALSCSTMEPLFVSHAYTGPIRSLLLVTPGQQSRMISRLLSHNKAQSKTQQPPSTSQSGSKKMLSPITSPISPQKSPGLLAPRPALHLNLKAMEPLPAEQSVLISFGLGYRGVVGDSENCPQEFILPSNNISSGGGGGNRTKKANSTKPAKPSVDDVHILLWSAGGYNKQIGSAKLESPQRRLESPQRRANSSSRQRLLVHTGKQRSREHT